jgi:hypothetical protein
MVENEEIEDRIDRFSYYCYPKRNKNKNKNKRKYWQLRIKA